MGRRGICPACRSATHGEEKRIVEEDRFFHTKQHQNGMVSTLEEAKEKVASTTFLG
jgi:hypothetical protein